MIATPRTRPYGRRSHAWIRCRRTSSTSDAVEDLRTALERHAEIETELFPRLRDEVGIGEQEHLSASLLVLREATL